LENVARKKARSFLIKERELWLNSFRHIIRLKKTAFHECITTLYIYRHIIHSLVLGTLIRLNIPRHRGSTKRKK